MKTVIRIKRRLDEEPVENIVVKPKRMRTCQAEGAAAADLDFYPAIVKRVATVNSKEEQPELKVLKTAARAYKRGWELRERYKILHQSEESKEPMKRGIKERIGHDIELLHSYKRRHIDDIEPSSDSSEDEDEETEADSNEEDTQEAEQSGEVDNASSVLAADEIKYLDAELDQEKAKLYELFQKDDVITCNSIPMQSEKYVYDIYYLPEFVDWTEYSCDIAKYENDLLDETHGDFVYDDDDDDENDEDNWRNDYPEEEDDDSSDEDVEDYVTKHLLKASPGYLNTDDSSDEDDSDEEVFDDEAFDEEGNLIYKEYDSPVQKLRRYVASIKLESDSEDD